MRARKSIGLDLYHPIGPDRDREILYGSPELIKGIGTNQCAISDSAHPMVGTYGLGPCIAIAGLDKETNTAFLSHNIPVKNLDDLNGPIFDELEHRGIDKNNLDYYLIGGNERYSKHLDDIKNYLNTKVKNPKIVYEDTIEKNDPKAYGKSFILDSRDGKFYAHNGLEVMGH